MRFREPFTVFPRRRKDGRVVYYYRIYDEDGNRLPPRSTGTTSPSAARKYCFTKWKEGTLIPSKDITFNTFSQGWWEYDTCPFIQGKLARGQSFSRNNAKIRIGIMNNHLRPTFGTKLLQNIRTREVEKWLIGFLSRGYSTSAANNNFKILSIMLGEAVRLGYIPKNPCDAVKPLKTVTKDKKLITPDEVRALFDLRHVDDYWDHRVNYASNLLAATSGLRLGELQALQVEDLEENYIHVHRALERGGFGLKDTKTHNERYIPLPEETINALKDFIGDQETGYIFSMDGGESPVAYTTITRSFFKALACIGITESKRVERNITFHGWRHYFNSRLRAAGVPDSKIQMLTGHKTTRMTDHYTHFTKEDFTDILNIRLA